MSDLDRVIGEVKGRFEAHEQWELEGRVELKKELSGMRTDIQSLKIWKAQVIMIKTMVIFFSGAIGGAVGFLAGLWKHG